MPFGFMHLTKCGCDADNVAINLRRLSLKIVPIDVFAFAFFADAPSSTAGASAAE
jgi:hypothetical protein